VVTEEGLRQREGDGLEAACRRQHCGAGGVAGESVRTGQGMLQCSSTGCG
jgi:hypothetical protein